jgi:thiamine biosynthesis protein ThiS
MKIILNNTEQIIDKETLTISELLQLRTFTFKMLVVKINGVLIRKPAYEHTQIHDGDQVIVLHLVSGG